MSDDDEWAFFDLYEWQMEEHILTLRPSPPDKEYGSFSIRQGGITVASGSGPMESVKREAAFYAMIYGLDGPVRVTIRKSNPRKQKEIAR